MCVITGDRLAWRIDKRIEASSSKLIENEALLSRL